MRLSEKLNLRMQMIGLTDVSDVARRAGVSKSSCYRWFEGSAQPRLSEALRLARVLGVTLDFLADDTLDSPPPGLTEAQRRLLWLADRVGVERAYLWLAGMPAVQQMIAGLAHDVGHAGGSGAPVVSGPGDEEITDQVKVRKVPKAPKSSPGSRGVGKGGAAS